MHFLVTGVGGFIGRRLVRHLVAAGDRVTGTWLDVEPTAMAQPGVDLVPADLLDAERLRTLLAETRPDVVIHLAGLSHVGESWTRVPDYFRVNVLGTENVLAAAGETPVVFASSAEVYGAVPEEEQPIAEECTLRPGTPYALTKAAAERLAVHAGAIVVRCFNLVGPGQSSRFALPAFAVQLHAIAQGRQEPVLKVGNLDARRDFVHVDDACDALRRVALRGWRGGVYNIASGTAWSLRHAVDRLLAISGVAARVEVDPARLRPLDLPVLRGDASKVRALGWEPTLDLERALADLWASVVAGETA